MRRQQQCVNAEGGKFLHSGLGVAPIVPYATPSGDSPEGRRRYGIDAPEVSHPMPQAMSPVLPRLRTQVLLAGDRWVAEQAAAR